MHKIVAHFIAGYPTMEGSLEAARGLIKGGASYLEMQIPFSDPFADGPTIEEACRVSLEQGCTVDGAFQLLETLRKEFPQVPIFLMSYGNIFFSRGIEPMVTQAKQAEVAGLIIPDLVYGYDENLYQLGARANLSIVPVITPSVSSARLKELIALKPEWIYTALRSGITGSKTTLDAKNIGLLEELKQSNVQVMAGFGIQNSTQVEELSTHCAAVVVGSAIVRSLTKAWESGESLEKAATTVVTQLLE